MNEKNRITKSWWQLLERNPISQMVLGGVAKLQDRFRVSPAVGKGPISGIRSLVFDLRAVFVPQPYYP